MKRITKHIPNMITSLNLFSGCVACVFSFYGEYSIATYFILMAAVFDFFDGFVARLLHAYSTIGKELDSLADMVSFGLAPAIMLFTFLSTLNPYFAFIAFLIPVFSALRLAKFNVDTRQSSSFIGLPTPANALFWVFLISNIPADFVLWIQPTQYYYTMLISLVLIAVSCYIMVAELPMFALKFKNFTWVDNKIRYVFLALSFVAIVLLLQRAFPVIIVLYIFMSIVNNFFNSPAETQES